MEAIETTAPVQLNAGPEIWCTELAAFDESDLGAVQEAFRAVKPCQMLQAWQPEVASQFAPAAVRVGWREGCFLVFAELTDADVFSHATEPNQRLWELRPANEPTYVQFDIAPNNQRMQLRIPSLAALRRAQTANEFAELVLPGNMIRSQIWLVPEQGKWFVFAAISAKAAFGSARGDGGRWHFSFSRYDHTRGQLEPVISSVSPHACADFHRQQEWGVLHVGAALLR
jgi:hypothetical protein